MKLKIFKQVLAGFVGAATLSTSAAANAAFVPELTVPSLSSATEAVIIRSYDFEDGDVSAFSKRGDTDTSVITADTDPVQGGIMLVSERSNGWNGPQIQVNTILEPGVKYNVRCKAKAEWYTELMLSIQKSPAEGDTSYGNLAKQVSQGEWVDLSASFSFSKSDGDVFIYLEGNSAETKLSVDDFVIEQAETYDIEDDIPSLKDTYAGYFKFGTACTDSELTPKTTKDLILKHFNSITLGNELKPEAMLDQAGCKANAEAGNEGEVSVKLNSAARNILDFARENGLSVRGHVLVWHSQTPGWFFKEGFSADGDYVSKEVMLQRMESYIKGVFEALDAEYSDVDFYAWDVVNEAWLDDGTPRKPGTYEESPQGTLSGWTAIFGDNSFIPYAFEYAREYAPANTKLYYNDFNEYMPQKVAAIVEMATELKEKGLIDGIGMQSHLDVRTGGTDAFPTASAYESALSKYAALGLDIQITELDATVPKDTGSQYFEQQAQYYSDIMDAIVKYKDSISAVVVWGTTDDQSWRTTQSPLLFNEDYTAKPCFYSIVDDITPLETVTTTSKTTTQTTTTPTVADETTITTTTSYPGQDTREINFTDTIESITVSDEIGEGGEIVFAMQGTYTFSQYAYTEWFKDYKAGDTVQLRGLVYDGNQIMTLYEINKMGTGDVIDLPGDANEDDEVNMADAVFIMRNQADPDEFILTERGRRLADVIGGSDGVTNNDALAIQKYEAGIYTSLPVEDAPAPQE
ncbi:MAG: endo-1,4-beta-xylanase [Ruminococcus sp.]|nr:endo-1,4-beta-xylanase [Ruminococcus sp.]